MFVDPQLHLYIAALAAVLYFLLPADRIRTRQWLLIAASLLLVAYAAPVAGLVAIGLSVFVFLVGRAFAARQPSKLALWSAVAVPVAVIVGYDSVLPTGSFFDKLGSSYFAIKSITILIDCRRGELVPTLRQTLLLNLWFPIYSAGPIERAKTFADEHFGNRLNLQDLGYGVARIAFGLFKTTYVVKALLSPAMDRIFGDVTAVATAGSAGMAFGFILMSFLVIYIGFSGYTDIALGTSRIFGLRVRENFNLPFLATSIQNFWQRWHLSLAQTVAQYLFLPIVRTTGKPAMAIFIAFVVIGLWHQISLTYFCWGVLHGAALAFNYRYSRYAGKRPGLKAFHANPLVRSFFRVVTLTYVAWVSAFANSPDIETALALSATLLRLG